MFAINQVTLNGDELLTKKKKDVHKIYTNQATFMKTNWEKCMTISTLVLTGTDQEIMSALFKTLPLGPENKLQVLNL